MQNLQTELVELLKTEENLVIEGELNKNKIIELALKVDPKLIQILIKNETFKKHFFQQVGEVLVFDKIKFQRFVSNKSFLPDSYTAFKNKIGLTINDGSVDNYIHTNKDVVLAWPHKDCVLEGGQTKEEQKRNEIFWNETLAPDSVDRLLDAKAFTNFKKYEGIKNENEEFKVKESEVTPEELDVTKENLILKGNNLLVLSSLLKTHRGKIKLIYIDPPYNTGSDSFQYNDSFNHSSWLTFMKNRLVIAKKLLKEDGSIFIHTDEKEISYLRVLCDEVFNSENYVSQITYERSSVAGLGQGGYFVNTGEYILIFTKGVFNFNEVLSYQPLEFKTMKRYNKVLKKEGTKKLIKEFNSKSNGLPVRIFEHFDYFVDTISLRKPKERLSEIKTEFKKNFDKVFRPFLIQKENAFQHEIISNMDKGLYSIEYTPSRGKNKDELTTLHYYDKGLVAWLADSSVLKDNEILKSTKLSNVWSHAEIPKADLHNEGEISFPRGKKPERLLERIISMASNPDDYVLDFFIGSGTTCATAFKMGRKFIGIEQLEYIENLPTKRLQNVTKGEQTGVSKSYNWQGGGSFIYGELLQFNQKYIDSIQNAESKDDLIRVWDDMKENAFISYQFDKSMFDKRLEAFKTASLEDMQKYLIEILDKNQLYVNYSEIEDESFKVSKEDIALNKAFYNK